MRWKVPTLAHPTVGQTSKSGHLGSISSRLKSPGLEIIQNFLERFLSINCQFCGNFATLKHTRSAPSGWISKFNQPLDAPGSLLSNALWFGTVRHTCERMKFGKGHVCLKTQGEQLRTSDTRTSSARNPQNVRKIWVCRLSKNFSNIKRLCLKLATSGEQRTKI